MNYKDSLTNAMTSLAKHRNTIFIGQAVSYPGTAMFDTLKDVPQKKKYEMPVTENMQMGISIGLALQGYVPISIYPRWNFLLCAVDQLVNHLDKISKMSNGGYQPKVIIRTSIGSERPLHPQHQHVGDYSYAIQRMLNFVDVVKLEKNSNIEHEYNLAYKSSRSSIMVEYGDLYNA